MADHLTMLATAVTMGGIVWKCFEKADGVLNDDAKLKIAVWLLERGKLGPHVQPWPDTFAEVFDRIFGTKHWSWRCFWKSCAASYFLLIVAGLIYAQISLSELHLSSKNFYSGFRFPGFKGLAIAIGFTLYTNAIPDYFSLLEPISSPLHDT